MADDDTTNGSPDGGAPSPEGADDQSGTDPAKVIEDLRKRQSGADKARDVALAERDLLQKQLDALLSGKTGQQDPNATKDEATIRAEVQREYDERLARERASDLAKVLDAQFPVARKKFPGITDAAQLAELETVFGDRAPAAAAPKPIGNNPASGGTGAKRIEDMSIAELRQNLDREAEGLLNPKS